MMDMVVAGRDIFITLVTDIWLLTSVCPHTRVKKTIMLESFVTLTALVWILICVCSVVVYSGTFFVKALSHWLQS